MAELVEFGPILLPKWAALAALVGAFCSWLALMILLEKAAGPSPRSRNAAG